MKAILAASVVALALFGSTVSASAAPQYVYYGQTAWAKNFFGVMGLVLGGGGDAGCGQ